MTTKPPPPKPIAIATVACAFELELPADGTVPTEAHLLPSGYFRATDGRPCECAAWFIDAAVAAQVIARMSALTNNTLIDYEHQSLNAAKNGQKVVAAGWFKSMRFDDAKGLYATNIDWVGEAAQHILKKEIRYVSAVFTYIDTTGEVLEIISAALTNTPAIDGLDDLAALNRRLAAASKLNPEDKTMTPEEIAALQNELARTKTAQTALTAQAADAEAKLAVLTKNNDALRARTDALEKEKTDAAAAGEKAQCTKIIEAALTSGKVLPAQRPFLDGLELAALTVYMETHHANFMAVLAKQHQVGASSATDGLSKSDLAMCAKMGVSPEQFLATKG
jgi:phage I-like protein